ncbi:MAG: hypothetical protein IT242_07155 [Bacteroidia bacterium]|nr:hypothetical protein [Bacteroidia bacterium]
MNWTPRIHDTLWTGTLIGIICLLGFFVLFTGIRYLLIRYFENPYILLPPRIHLFTIGANVLLFRFLMLKWNREKTGKGVLLVTLIAAIICYFLEPGLMKGGAF